MRKITIFLLQIVLFLIGVSTYATDYKTSNIYLEKEIKYIEKLQKENIKIGTYWGSRFLDKKDPEKSLIYQYEKQLENFFHFNITVETDSWVNMHNRLKDKEIDILPSMVITEERKLDFNFSIPIYENKIYIVAGRNNIPLSSWKDLEGKEVVVLASSYYSDYLKKFRNEEFVDFQIREVDIAPSAGEYDYALLPSEKINEKYKLKKLKMKEIDPIGFGITKSKLSLKKILDKSLEYKYKNEILNLLEKDRLRRVKRDFYELLTSEEKEYLKKKESIEVFYETDFYPMIYYDGDKKEYDGIFVRGLDQISLLLNKPIQKLNHPKESWTSIYKRFKQGEGDLIPIFLTPERAKIHKFSSPLDHENLFLVANKNKVNEINMRVGILKNDITEEAAKKYLSKDKKLISYENFIDMIDALKKEEIESCVIDDGMFRYFHKTRFDLKLQKIRLLGSFPISLIYQNDNSLLQSILLKARGNSIDYQEVKSVFLKEMQLVKAAKARENEKKNFFFLKLAFFLVATIIFLISLNRYFFRKRLHKLTYFDQLTSALNRVSLIEEFRKLDFEKGNSVGMYIDLDGFKQINEKYGHHIGDLILKKTVERLQKLFEKKDVFRLAGDEFVVFKREGNSIENLEFAKKIIEELEKPIKLLEYNIRTEISIGICQIDNKVKYPEDFLHWLYVAMYWAKKSKYYSIVIATEELVKAFDNELKLVEDLKKALKKKEICAYFQPKVDLNNGEILGLEALARWNHKENGFVSPEVFIPLAEDMGLISKLDFIIAETTIKTLKKWMDSKILPKNFRASFNISVKTFEDIDVYENLKFLIEKYGVSGEVLEVEVTESVFIKKINKIMNELNSLKDDLGITVALDDFSAGHSSLKELGKLPIDTLKFDRSLLLAIKENPERGKIIYSNLINLCNDMGYDSLAEGMEDKIEVDFLKEKGVKYGQGYYFGRPMPEESFFKRLNEINK